MTVSVSLVGVDDAAELADLHRANRAFMLARQPPHPEDFYTEAGQRETLRAILARHERGTTWPGVIREDGAIVGVMTLHNIVRAVLQSCFVGYWVTQDRNGRGIASTALRDCLAVAFDDLGLHRVDAFTDLDNAASQRVLAHNGFGYIGVSPRHIHIGGRWLDQRLYSRLAS